MATAKGPCAHQQELIEVVRKHLARIAELSRETAEALAARDVGRAMEIDKKIELELGAKERGMGALHEHKREHGC